MSDPATADLDSLVADLGRRGVRRLHSLAWRDLDDPDAGGSELHLDHCERRWAAAGLEIVHRTSASPSGDADLARAGYRIVRRGGRHTVFPRATLAELTGRYGRSDALVEVWNGVPWFSPVWYRRPHVTVVHHVHGPMWDQMFPGPLAAVGRGLETRVAPVFYRSTSIVTPSDATRAELIALGFSGDSVTSIPNGHDPRFTPGGEKTSSPSIVAVGRLAPVKRFDLVISAAAAARRRIPDLTLTIVGDGALRPELEAQVARADAAHWISLAGRVDDAELIEIYRRSWLVVSGSLAEGWGLSLTEAAGCGTAAVATDIGGHRSSVVDGETGVLVEESRLGAAIADLLDDHQRRAALETRALERARRLSWDATATGVLACLHRDVVARDGA